MNRQDATHPTTEPTTLTPDPEEPQLDPELEAFAKAIVDRYLPACRERLSPPARTLLALLVRAESLPVGGNMQLVSGQIQSAKALELRGMLATWEPFAPEARFMTRAQRRRSGRKMFARITERGKEVLIAWERCNVPESDYTPGIHPSYAER